MRRSCRARRSFLRRSRRRIPREFQRCPIGSRNFHRATLRSSCSSTADGMLEANATVREASQPVEQSLLEFRLIEGAERRMTVDALGDLERHERRAPRIEMADRRVSHEARRDLARRVRPERKDVRFPHHRRWREEGRRGRDFVRRPPPSRPLRPRRFAVINPIGPAPTTTTSYSLTPHRIRTAFDVSSEPTAVFGCKIHIALVRHFD